MRMSGAPSIIRKRAAAVNEATDSINPQTKKRKFFHPVPRSRVLQQLPSNGNMEPSHAPTEDDSFKCKSGSSKFKAAGVEEVDKEVIIIGEDEYDSKAGKDEDCLNIFSEASLFPIRKQDLSRTGDPSERKKARLGVGLIKPGFKPPAPMEVKFGASKEMNCTDVQPREPDCSSPFLNKPGSAGLSWRTEEEDPSNYYCVMYCRRKLNAKHKGPWSDGVLISRGRTCTLQDTEGKMLTKDNGHRRGDMSEGATFPLGKFEVEIMKKSTEEEFFSGKIFTGTLELQVDNASNLVQTRSFRSFRRPIVTQSEGGAANTSTTSPVTCLHSSLNLRQTPTSTQKIASVQQVLAVKQDALVLNAREIQRGATPVVVDPYLASKLREHQQEGVRFMYECVMGLRNHKFTGCLLADAMGLGKTLQVIALIWTLLHQGPTGRPAVKRVLVICPSTLVENWGNEVRKWLGSERLNALIIHSGTSTKDVKRKISTFQIGKISPVLITSYEFLRKYNDDIRSAKPELLICDEAHRLKNCAGNKTIDSLLALMCSKKVLLTGTPVQNDLMEFYAMLDFANKDLLGPISAFKRLYADPIEKSRDRNASDEEKILGRKRSAELQLRTRPYILQRSSDVNLTYLPVKTELIVFCKLQAQQVSLYQKFLKSKTVETLFHPSNQSAVILSAIGTLRKLCNHPQLVLAELTKEKSQTSPDKTQNQSDRSEIISESGWTSSGKLDCLYKIISAVHTGSSSGTLDKLVVVSNFTQTLDIIQTLCEAQGWKWLRLDGSTEICNRQIMVDRFNAEYSKERVFLLSSKAGGSGLNLIGANRLILFDPDWNPATDAQAMARVWRDGQKKPVVIYRLLSTGSIEEKIYQRQIMKQEVAAAIGEQMEGQSGRGGRHFSREELRELFTLRLDTRCDTYDLLNKSIVRGTQPWRDYSEELQDYALEKAIQKGVVSFVHRKVEKTDVRSFDCSSSGDDTSKSSETMTQKHPSDIDLIESCSLSTESFPTLRGYRGKSYSSDGYSPARKDLYRLELEEDGDRSKSVENAYVPSPRSEPVSPLFVRTESEDHEGLRMSSAHSSEPVCGRLRPIEVDCVEVNNDDPNTGERYPEMLEDGYDCVYAEQVSEQENYADVESDGRQVEHSHFLNEGMSTCENKSSLQITCQPDRYESTTPTSSMETSRDPICQSENNCCCLLGAKGHKLLHYMLETLRSKASDVDDLEALDLPFLSSLELEVELQTAEFTPRKLWEGFKLFVFGFLLGEKAERIYYRCSTLGLIFDKCNGDKTSTIESVFCKGLPLVISALSRRHGCQAVELPTLLSLYEDEGQLQMTPVGRFLTELTRRCKASDI